MTAPRRENPLPGRSDAILDAAERLMAKKGYAAVTYRNVAAEAGLTAGLVQYYFPRLDHLLLTMVERRGRQNLDRLLDELAARPDQPLRVVWELSGDEQSAVLQVEFMALANHRKGLQVGIREVTEQLRSAQLAALQARWDDYGLEASGLTPGILVFLLHTVPKMLLLEESVGMTAAHEDLLKLVERSLHDLEPAPTPRTRSKRS